MATFDRWSLIAGKVTKKIDYCVFRKCGLKNQVVSYGSTCRLKLQVHALSLHLAKFLRDFCGKLSVAEDLKETKS